MAATWKWNSLVGIRIHENGVVENLYSGGNCVMVQLYEWTEEGDEEGYVHYNFNGFWNDLDHLKNCLGLGKTHKGDSIYRNENVSWVFYSNSGWSYLPKVCELFAKAGMNFEVCTDPKRE